MANASPTTQATPVEQLGSDPVPEPEVAVDELDDLVEDVSIDGMCGVY
jgi:mycofactocin precursor